MSRIHPAAPGRHKQAIASTLSPTGQATMAHHRTHVIGGCTAMKPNLKSMSHLAGAVLAIT
jgi:hypothetical protein